MNVTPHEFDLAKQELAARNICEVESYGNLTGKGQCKEEVRFTSRRIARAEKDRKNNALYQAKHRMKVAEKRKVRAMSDESKPEKLVSSYPKAPNLPKDSPHSDQGFSSSSSLSLLTSDSEELRARDVPAMRKKTARVLVPVKTELIWLAYAQSYQKRYGVPPVRNARTHGLLAQVIRRIGTEEAPAVAAFYLELNQPFYVGSRHPPNLLLRDCESLRTQWATGDRVTTREVRSAEQRDNVMEQYKRLTQPKGTAHGG